jgi:hypothetical protein
MIYVANVDHFFHFTSKPRPQASRITSFLVHIDRLSSRILHATGCQDWKAHGFTGIMIGHENRDEGLIRAET